LFIKTTKEIIQPHFQQLYEPEAEVEEGKSGWAANEQLHCF
jgi:hypothetical protein